MNQPPPSPPSHDTAGPITVINSGLGSAIGVISFAFVCHQTTFLIHNSLEDNTEERWNKVGGGAQYPLYDTGKGCFHTKNHT